MIKGMNRVGKVVGRYSLPMIVGGVYIFLYVPIIVLVLFSFNASDLLYTWSGFSLKWYKTLFFDHEIWHVCRNSLIVAFSAVGLSVSMGTMLVYGARRYIDRISVLFYGSILFPEIVLAVGLLGFFFLFSVPFGLITLIAGHTLLGLGFVIPIMHARFNELNAYVEQAALDLGASQLQTFFYVILPFLFPSLMAAGLLVMIVSFDDFLISFFCAGSTAQTLSLYIFAMIRSGISPEVNALSTLVLAVSSLVVLIFSFSRIRVMDKLS